jgi:sec-independent protein translocase protein TatA
MISTPVFAIIGIPGLGVQELIIILVIVLILFGPKRLPQLGKSLGKTMKAIRDGAEGKMAETDEGADADAAGADADAPKKASAKAEAKPKADDEE